MPKVVGIKFKQSGKIYDFSPNGLDLKVGDKFGVRGSYGNGFKTDFKDKLLDYLNREASKDKEFGALYNQERIRRNETENE